MQSVHFVTCSHYLKFLEYVTLKDACPRDVKIYLDKKNCMHKAIEDKFQCSIRRIKDRSLIVAARKRSDLSICTS